MKIFFRAAFIICVFVVASCTGTKKITSSATVRPLSENPPSEGSLVYGLPRSVFTVVVEMERTIEIPGPYRRYAGELLGLDKVIQNEGEFWTITGVDVRSDQELDPSEFYVIKSNSVFQSNALALRSEGLILDPVPGIFRSPGSLQTNGRAEDRQFHSLDLGSDEYYLTQRDTAFKRVNVDSTFIRIPYIVEKKRKLSDEQLAERAAKRLMEMRDGKHLILTGEANVFPQHEAALKEMNRLEKEYTELFTGKTVRESRTFTYQVIPNNTMAGKKVPLFTFSELTGPSEGGATGEQVTIEFIPEQKTKDLIYSDNVTAENGDEPVYEKLYYRVPDVATLKIRLGDETLFNSRRLVYQFGKIVQLPSNYIIGR